MKSIVQEASSLSKAIEQGWLKAGKPTLFSVRIMQEPSKNFIGMTTKTAKIVIFFGRFDAPITEQQHVTQKSAQQQTTQQKVQQRPLKQQQQQQPRGTRQNRNYRRYRPQQNQQQRPQQQQQQDKQTTIQEPPKPQS